MSTNCLCGNTAYNTSADFINSSYNGTWYSASLWIITSEALRYGTCSQGISQFYLHTLMFNLQSEWAIPAFAFPAIAGTHLSIPEGWKAVLAWLSWFPTGVGWIVVILLQYTGMYAEFYEYHRRYRTSVCLCGRLRNACYSNA